MGRILLFNIRNQQEDYAKSLKYINCLERHIEWTEGASVCRDYAECDINQNKYNLACSVEKKQNLTLIDKQFIQTFNLKNVFFYFRITMEKEDDIVNLMYLYLIRQRFRKILAVLITPGLEYDMKISAYLSFELKKDKNTVFIKTNSDEIEKYGEVHRLPGSSTKMKKEWRLTKFLPLIEVTAKTYSFLSNTVENAKKIVEENSGNENIWERKVLNICTNLITQYRKVKSEKWIQEPQFVNLIKNVPVLTYILFCAFRNHCEARRTIFDITRVEQELSDARDIAEGILQILENIIQHSQNKVGYFSFRIHDHQRKVENNYLNNNYSEYLGLADCRGYDTFLELFIADCLYSLDCPKNENMLCIQFLNNLKERSLQNNKIKPFINKFKSLSVKDFFENEIWREYNSVSDNIIEHYGLQLFDKIVNSCSGCFKLISSDNYEYGDKQYYCSPLETAKDDVYAIPGTQYKVLLPVKERSFIQEYSGLDFCDYPKTSMIKPLEEHIKSEEINLERKIIEFNHKINVDNKYKYFSDIQREKNQKNILIYALSDFISEKLEESVTGTRKFITHFLLNRIKGAGLVEIIFKACLKAIIKTRDVIGNDEKIYITFGNLTKEFINEFCYLMGIYYYKTEESFIMKNTEMYFWGNEYCEDLLITGENLKVAHTAILKRAVLRGIYPHWIPFINYVWKKYERYGKAVDANEELITLPYDVIVKHDGKTVFQNVVEKVLNKPIEHRELGCLISNTHIQLASQIHISEFYDGQMLFLNNYFTNYFSFMIVDRISNIINSQRDNNNYNKKNIVFVGYEGYSEMLLVETNELLKSYLKNNKLSDKYQVEPYIIAEIIDKKMVFRSALGRIEKEWEEFSKIYKAENVTFAFVMPLGSTLTTFEKIQFEMEKALGVTINKNNNMINLALIISRDNYILKCEDIVGIEKIAITDEEGEYWKRKNGNIITTKDRELDVEFFVEVCGKWERASNCSQCFPDKNIYEKPLIKTSISGLSPLTQFGEKRKWKNDCNTSVKNISRVKKLSEVLTYNHIQRGGNHYLYYFDTTEFFYENRELLENWMKEIKADVSRSAKHYSFIVSPLHETNAGFTEEINRIIFDNTAHIIRLNFNKVFRSNFMLQFSYLQILYNNLLNAAVIMNEKSEINFYFVDDEVVSGRTVLRAKNLIQGLFENLEKDDRVEVHVFKKIYVLIDRLSDFSKRNYVEKVEDYVSFVTFNVSVIQNHDDFCFMCKLVNNARGFKYMSATNKMDESWKRIEKKFELKNYAWIEKHSENRQESYKNRMLAAHYAEAEMSKLGENATVGEYFDCMLDRLFYNKLYKRKGNIILSDNNQEIFVSYIKTLSRPFFVYRKNAKEAALSLVILFMEIFLGENFELLCADLGRIEHRDELCALHSFINEWRKKRDESTYNLLLDFMEQLTDMESVYIIRRDNIVNIFNAYNQIPEESRKNINIREKYREDFELQYAIFIKQITNEEADENKGLHIERLFLNGNEGENGIQDNEFCELYGYLSSFGQKVLIENTKIIYDGIKYLSDIIAARYDRQYEKLVKGEQGDFASLHKLIDDVIMNEVLKSSISQMKYFKIVIGYYSVSQKIFSYAVLFYMLMFKLKTDEIPFDLFYKELYRLITGITHANVQILMIPNMNEMDEEWMYPDEPCIIYDERKEINQKRRIKLEEEPFVESEYLRNLVYEFDTYNINEQRNQVIIKYNISSKYQHEKNYIYLILKYNAEQDMKNLLFKLRLVLLCRSRTITRIKRDFKNNLFQSLWQTKKHNLLLEHFKNASHSSPEQSVTYKTVDYMRLIAERCEREGCSDEENMAIRVYKAMLLKLLADNNISILYHEILCQRLLCNYATLGGFSDIKVFENIEDLRFIINKGRMDQFSEEYFSDDSSLPRIEIDQDVYNGLMYYIAPNACQSQLIVISLIQNAYKHGNNCKMVHLYREKSTKEEDRYPDYLCISNGITVNNIEQLRNRIEEVMKKPISLRKLNMDKKRGEGITLFSVYRYCEKILEGLGCSIENDNIIKFELTLDEIIFKIPILKGDNIE